MSRSLLFNGRLDNSWFCRVVFAEKEGGKLPIRGPVTTFAINPYDFDRIIMVSGGWISVTASITHQLESTEYFGKADKISDLYGHRRSSILTIPFETIALVTVHNPNISNRIRSANLHPWPFPSIIFA